MPSLNKEKKWGDFFFPISVTNYTFYLKAILRCSFHENKFYQTWCYFPNIRIPGVLGKMYSQDGIVIFVKQCLYGIFRYLHSRRDCRFVHLPWSQGSKEEDGNRKVGLMFPNHCRTTTGWYEACLKQMQKSRGHRVSISS